LPAVVTDVGGNGEVVDDSTTGFLVPPRAPEALAQAALPLLRDSRLAHRMGAAARARLEDKFDLQTTIARYQDLYAERLSRRRRRAH
jgi:glycosyltransferase involved in cell wall biosynthesis